MKVTVFNGSPRGRNSNTNIIVGCLFEGMKDAGAEVESVFLSEKKIIQCMGCLKCFTKTPGKCCMTDDMSELLQKYAESDFIGFATPIFSCNMTALMKNFLDRTIPLKSAQTMRDEDGNYYHPINCKESKIFVVSNCGFPGSNNFDVLKVSFSPYFPVAEIYRNAGELLQEDGEDRSLFGKDIVSRIKGYKKDLRKAGYELITNGCISEDTLNDLSKPLEADDVIQDGLNNYFDSEQKKTKG